MLSPFKETQENRDVCSKILPLIRIFCAELKGIRFGIRNIGRTEYWNYGFSQITSFVSTLCYIVPSYHHSIIPRFF
jgi:hypothetical protein